MVEEKPNEVKVILLGEAGVGKTSLINVAIGENFSDDVPSTASASFVTKKFHKENKDYTLNIWDTAGQEKFRAMSKLFIKYSKIVIFVYAINDKKSFDSLNFWVSTVKEILGEDIILAVVGNKYDLYLQEKIKSQEAEEYANSINAKFETVSAKMNPGAFISLLENLLDNYLKKGEDSAKKPGFEKLNQNCEKKKRKYC